MFLRNDWVCQLLPGSVKQLMTFFGHDAQVIRLNSVVKENEFFKVWPFSSSYQMLVVYWFGTSLCDVSCIARSDVHESTIHCRYIFVGIHTGHPGKKIIVRKGCEIHESKILLAPRNFKQVLLPVYTFFCPNGRRMTPASLSSLASASFTSVSERKSFPLSTLQTPPLKEPIVPAVSASSS